MEKWGVLLLLSVLSILAFTDAVRTFPAGDDVAASNTIGVASNTGAVGVDDNKNFVTYGGVGGLAGVGPGGIPFGGVGARVGAAGILPAIGGGIGGGVGGIGGLGGLGGASGLGGIGGLGGASGLGGIGGLGGASGLGGIGGLGGMGKAGGIGGAAGVGGAGGVVHHFP